MDTYLERNMLAPMQVINKYASYLFIFNLALNNTMDNYIYVCIILSMI